MKRYVLGLMFLCAGFSVCFAQVTAGSIQRSEELIEKEKELRQKVEVPSKVFPIKFMVEGASLLTAEEIMEIASAYRNRWLGEKEVNELFDLIRKAYEEKGFSGQPQEISYRMRSKYFMVLIVEEGKD
ncbi:POTRA domain-containing protein [Candidatus Omnitrophota bacterium]